MRSNVRRGPADYRVERLLYRRAVGYSYKAVKVMQHNGVPVYADFIEHVPRDPGAAKLWLTNRRSEEWRDKTYIEHAGRAAIRLSRCCAAHHAGNWEDETRCRAMGEQSSDAIRDSPVRSTDAATAVQNLAFRPD